MVAKRWCAAALWFVSATCLPSVPTRAEVPLQSLEVDTASGPHIFHVEVMSTDEERARGLMDRKSLPKDYGMLFDFHTPQPVWFWMKDTYLPLDMLFVAADGHVVTIKRDAKPMDETLIPSGKPTLGVIEVNAGIADAIGVKVGDVVKHPIFHDVGEKK